ncbi:MAG: 4-hydroxy-3-polyprenylbenzoate decarboxylase, partial [Actinomycetota bacterium]|nr:4-hydroxy-3-polyprenylbenzoate decarboxylase [Actinomycetota bacterium]
MAYADLPEFLDRLEKDGELVRVKAPVDPYLEITEIVDRVVRAGGPALLFENVVGSKLPLAMNVFGTQARMAKALDVDSLDDVGARIADLLKPELPRGFAGLRDAMSKLGQLRDVPPKRVRKGDCQDVVVKGDKVDLMTLPALHTWPNDGGAYFNLG